jgi:hypothetical protein
MKFRFLFVFCFSLTVINAQNNLTSTMPAEKYGYRLTPDQMTFGQWLIHSIERNYTDCAALKGEVVPDAQKQAASLTGKAEISKALKDSFAYCAAALEGMDDAKVISSPRMSYAFLHIAVHNNEIYGNIVGYLRANGVIPPSTAARLSQQTKSN